MSCASLSALSRDLELTSQDEHYKKAKFEVVVYELLRSEPNILASCLLYYRIPVQHTSPRLELPQDCMAGSQPRCVAVH